MHHGRGKFLCANGDVYEGAVCAIPRATLTRTRNFVEMTLLKANTFTAKSTGRAATRGAPAKCGRADGSMMNMWEGKVAMGQSEGDARVR